MKSDGSVQVWGDSDKGGTDPSITSVANIYSTTRAFVAVGSTSLAYGPEVTGSSGGSVTKNIGCDQCPAGYNNAALDDILGPATTCDFIPCGVNEHVSGGQCTACVGGTRAAGDSDPLVDTYCSCDANYHVVSNTCTQCPGTATKAAGDDSGGVNTYCICGLNEYVSNNVCTLSLIHI